ncbi:MAG: aspartate ammonia-lyase [Candidatus Melainabacteria bacterium]|nr:aspartate ammonia-lyase [Candidatus Melainabacteria bacterium]
MPVVAPVGRGFPLLASTPTRKEKDPMGEVELPDSVYYGVQTQRALNNFPISGITADPDFIKASILIKKAAAIINAELGEIDQNISHLIIQACDEVLSGQFRDNFVVDVYQSGAGTSHNMNINEVLANRAIELSGGKKGDYQLISPNDHVNCAQSTNDHIPTAMRIACLIKSSELLKTIDECSKSLEEKGTEFYPIIKAGRTHLKDAVPVRLGREFQVYSRGLSEHKVRLQNALEEMKTIGIGGTAIGTGLNTHPLYQSKMIAELSKLTGFDLKAAPDLMLATQNMSPFVGVSNAIKNLVLDLTKICNDLRLMDSGPTTGLSEIRLPSVQPGSSIMPGKINPSMVELVNQVCIDVKGNCSKIEDASSQGQFELNVMMPIINFNLLHSIKILTNALKVWNEKCLKGITANDERCNQYAEGSISNVTALNPEIGYLKAAEIAKEAIATGKTIKEICKEKQLLPDERLNELLDLEKQVGK